MKPLIIYYSHTRNNQALALELQKRLQCDIEQITELKKRTGFTILLDLAFNRNPSIKNLNVSLEQYDHVVLIAPIWASKIASPLKSFLTLKGDSLKKYSFITVCSGVDGQEVKIKKQLIKLTGKEPAQVLELKIRDLLAPEQKGKIKYETPFRIREKDLVYFDKAIEEFVNNVSVAQSRAIA
jgi:flavodoxin